MGKLFGTDGIRGIANLELDGELAYRVGRAAGKVLAAGTKSVVVIGRDTRMSGELIESAVSAGFMSMGLDVLSVGVMPTPGVAYLTVKYKAALGVVISASHNPGEYNGIKLFAGDGYKIPDSVEEEIEDLIVHGIGNESNPIGEKVGKIYYSDQGMEDYIAYLTSMDDLDLKGFKVVLDCGNGALFRIAPEVIRCLNGEAVILNVDPNGMNINDGCGSTNPEIVSEAVLRHHADIGLSFDGDGDRLIAVDEKGRIVNGDHILAICAQYLKERGELPYDTVVGTVMTNMGLDMFLGAHGMKIEKTLVGDRYILEEMRKKGYRLGGEQSGHIIFLDYNTTGDGLATGLHLLKILKESGKKFSELNDLFSDMPQVVVNAKVRQDLKHHFLENEEVKNEIDRVNHSLKGNGRVLVRASGTEPIVRVMIESEHADMQRIAKKLAEFIEERLS